MTTPTPALRSALRTALEDRYKFDVPDETLDCILSAITPFLAPAPVEQARGARAAYDKIYTGFNPAGFEMFKKGYAARHFQSLATEKPTSGETGGEAKPGHCRKCGRGISLCACLQPDAGSPNAQSQTPMTDLIAKNIGMLAARWKQGDLYASDFAVMAQAEINKLGVLETALAAAKQEATEAKEQWRMSSVCRELAADRDALAEKLRKVEGERDAAELSVASIADFTNMLCREFGTSESPNAEPERIKTAIEGIYGRGRAAQSQLRELGEQLEGAKADCHSMRMLKDEALKSWHDSETRLAALQQQVGEADKVAEALEGIKAVVKDVLMPIINEAIAAGHKVYTWTPEMMQLSLAIEKTDAALESHRLARQPDQRQGEGPGK